jgi:hypothetical protein
VNELERLRGSDYRIDEHTEEIIAEQVRVLSPLNAARSGSFKLMSNLGQDAASYQTLFDCYTR